MSTATSTHLDEVNKGFTDIIWRAFCVFAILVLISLALFVFGSVYGDKMSNAGHSTSRAPVKIIIANDVFSIPSNMIRHEAQRQSGRRLNVNLYVHWPSMQGYSSKLAPFFRENDPSNMEIVLTTISERRNLLDMSERFQPVYKSAIDKTRIRSMRNGLSVAPLLSTYGFMNEKLVFSPPDVKGEPAFIARCQASNNKDARLLLPCETDIFIGRSSSARIRFPLKQLSRWKLFSAEINTYTKNLLAEQ